MRLPSPKEVELHCMVAAIVRDHLHPLFRCTHMPMGEYRDKVTAGRLKAMGVTPFWPDFLFVGPHKRVHWLELKREGAKPTAGQIEHASHLMACGHTYHWTTDFKDAIDQLRGLGIIVGVRPQ